MAVFSFLFCGLIWGSSYFWIKVALEEIGPATLISYRFAFALLGLVPLLWLRRGRLPRDLKTVAHLAALSVVSPGLPFFLTAWSETRIDSGLAAILNGTMPILTTLAAHFMLHDDRMTGAKILGVGTGFAGVLVLFSRNLGHLFAGSGLGQLAILGASALYALANVYARNLLRRLAPMTVTLGQMFFGLLIAGALTLALERPVAVPTRFWTWFAVAWMGLLGSCATFILYHWLMTKWGASRTSLTNYIVPAVGLALGLLLRGEQADWRLLAGSALILSGVAVVNLKALLALLFRSRQRS